jgi:hypothetical protein
MGAWGSGPFENDFAADWVYELEAADDFGAVRASFSSVVETTGYLDALYGSIALAAAEVVAASRQRPTSPLPEPITRWVTAHGSKLNEADVNLALSAVDRVLAEDSELRELWAESDENAWFNAVEDVRRRLGSD